MGTGLVHLRCQNYNIEDKSRDHEEDDRKRRRGGGDRGYSGPTQTFSEKKGYKPSVNIEYIDDSGRSMSSKKSKRGTWEEVDHEIVESGKWKEGTRGKPSFSIRPRKW